MIIFKAICQKWGRIHFYCVAYYFLQFINIFFLSQSASCFTKFQEVQFQISSESQMNLLNDREYLLIKLSVIYVDSLQDG